MTKQCRRQSGRARAVRPGAPTHQITPRSDKSPKSQRVGRTPTTGPRHMDSPRWCVMPSADDQLLVEFDKRCGVVARGMALVAAGTMSRPSRGKTSFQTGGFARLGGWLVDRAAAGCRAILSLAGLRRGLAASRTATGGRWGGGWIEDDSSHMYTWRNNALSPPTHHPQNYHSSVCSLVHVCCCKLDVVAPM